MAFLDILKGRKREEVKPGRLPKGAFKHNEKLVKKRAGFSVREKSEKMEEKNVKKDKTVSVSPKIQTNKSGLAGQILVRPHITERATDLSRRNIYTFQVAPRTNKILIKKAVQEMYGFNPYKIRIINSPAKTRITRGKIGVKPGFKKALVYLKEGDKIEFI